MKQIHVSMSAASPEIRTYTGLKVVFTDHNPRHDLMLKRGEKFVIDGDKLYDPENKRIKFTMSKKEIKDLLANSRVAVADNPVKPRTPMAEKKKVDPVAVGLFLDSVASPFTMKDVMRKARKDPALSSFLDANPESVITALVRSGRISVDSVVNGVTSYKLKRKSSRVAAAPAVPEKRKGKTAEYEVLAFIPSDARDNSQQDQILITRKTLIEVFGAKTFNAQEKARSIWYIRLANGRLATIYAYKVPPAKINKNGIWSIGGTSPADAKAIRDILTAKGAYFKRFDYSDAKNTQTFLDHVNGRVTDPSTTGAKPAKAKKAKAEPKEKERKLSDFGGYTMRNFKSYMTPRGVDYHATVYKDGKALGTIHHIAVEITPRLDFNIEQLQKDAKRLKFDDAYDLLSELSFVVETAAANKKK